MFHKLVNVMEFEMQIEIINQQFTDLDISHSKILCICVLTLKISPANEEPMDIINNET